MERVTAVSAIRGCGICIVKEVQRKKKWDF
jgi:hypothetical protein